MEVEGRADLKMEEDTRLAWPRRLKASLCLGAAAEECRRLFWAAIGVGREGPWRSEAWSSRCLG